MKRLSVGDMAVALDRSIASGPSTLAAAMALAMSFASGAQAQVSTDVVKIGLLIDMSGSYSDLSGAGSVVAGRMAVEDFGGKVLGKPIELVFADSQNKADVAATKAREWFDTGNVDAILDRVPTNVALAVMEVAAIPNGTIRDDGRLVHDMLLVQVKKPSESKSPWDYYHVRDLIPGDQAFKPLAQSTCPLVKK